MDKSIKTKISNLAQDGVSSAWYDSKRDLEALYNGWDGSAKRRFRKDVYTDPELSGSLKRLSEDVWGTYQRESRTNKASVTEEEGGMKLNDETKRGECMTRWRPEV